MLLKIGELAKRAGLTVRTVHHYDHIGLLSPTARSGSGFRLYDQADVERLHKIQALKQFGCSLSEIGEFLAKPEGSPIGIITRQMSVLDEQVLQAQALRDRLARLRERISNGEDTGLSDWLRILELMTMYEKHFSKEQDGGENRLGPAPKPSALSVAILRAAHQLLDNPLVFEDPLAFSILSAAEEASLRGNPSRFDTPLARAIRTSVAVRSRLAEDEWGESKRRGVRQYVILGAGLDTFAYRNPDGDRVRVFEVDLPATQAWKRERLRAAGIVEPASLSFVPTDFEGSTLAGALGGAGFRRDAPAFFSWLGVTMYLEEDAIKDTLRFIASLAKGSGVVFDYGVDSSLLGPRERKALEYLTARTSEHGEPWKTLFDPAKLIGMLRSLGFGEGRDFGPEQLNERYLAGRYDGLHKSGVSRLVWAEV